MGRRPRIPGDLATFMRQDDRHAWTLEDLQTALTERGTPADFSSVFRAMAKLESDGVVRKLELDDGRARFELQADHHDHLLCNGCGQVSPVPCGVVAGALAEAEQATGFAVSGHWLVLTGTCPQCRRLESSGGPSAPAAADADGLVARRGGDTGHAGGVAHPAIVGRPG